MINLNPGTVTNRIAQFAWRLQNRFKGHSLAQFSWRAPVRPRFSWQLPGGNEILMATIEAHTIQMVRRFLDQHPLEVYIGTELTQTDQGPIQRPGLFRFAKTGHKVEVIGDGEISVQFNFERVG